MPNDFWQLWTDKMAVRIKAMTPSVRKSKGMSTSAGFASDTDKAKCNAIRAMLDDVFGPPQGIESVSAVSAVGNSGQGIKIMQDGQLFILLNGKRYSTLGQAIE